MFTYSVATLSNPDLPEFTLEEEYEVPLFVPAHSHDVANRIFGTDRAMYVITAPFFPRPDKATSIRLARLSFPSGHGSCSAIYKAVQARLMPGYAPCDRFDAAFFVCAHPPPPRLALFASRHWKAPRHSGNPRDREWVFGSTERGLIMKESHKKSTPQRPYDVMVRIAS